MMEAILGGCLRALLKGFGCWEVESTEELGVCGGVEVLWRCFYIQVLRT